jgi:zinc/manganese transport system permease protein
MTSVLSELRWMLPPLAMCLVLTGIHGYLGIHVLSRKVIFVDLALAQIAALGSTYAFLLGYDPRTDSGTVYLFSLGFTFIGAAVFSLTRMRHDKVPQEAFIGIVYATASATSLLLLAKASGEAEHIKEMLVGNILLVTWPTIIKTAIIYAVIGAFHWIFRKPFFEISADPEAALARGRRVRLWDFFFYASFGLVITSSVAVAGVLLVF